MSYWKKYILFFGAIITLFSIWKFRATSFGGVVVFPLALLCYVLGYFLIKSSINNNKGICDKNTGGGSYLCIEIVVSLVIGGAISLINLYSHLIIKTQYACELMTNGHEMLYCDYWRLFIGVITILITTFSIGLTIGRYKYFGVFVGLFVSLLLSLFAWQYGFFCNGFLFFLMFPANVLGGYFGMVLSKRCLKLAQR